MSQKSIIPMSLILSSLFLFNGCQFDEKSKEVEPIDNKAKEKTALGKKFFEDTTFSKNDDKACITCHLNNKDLSYISETKPFEIYKQTITEQKKVESGGFVGGNVANYLGVVGETNPNSPNLNFIPLVESNKDKTYFVQGGLNEGKFKNVKERLEYALLSNKELGTTKEKIVATLREDETYHNALIEIYGEEVFETKEKIYDAFMEIVQNYQETLISFTSKFDKVRVEQNTYTEAEKRGYDLFMGKANCVKCHLNPLYNFDFSTYRYSKPNFTDYGYANLGIPLNPKVEKSLGVYENLLSPFKENALKGKFQTKSLRNVAVTSPYMHNGAFKNLKTVIHFYNTRDVKGAINPETQKEWEEAETSDNITQKYNIGNLGLSDSEENDIVSFLQTLTDEEKL